MKELMKANSVISQFAQRRCHDPGGGDAGDEEVVASTDTEEETPSEPASIYLVTQGDTVTVVDEAAMLNGCVDVDVTVDIDGAHIVVKELEILTEQDICRCVYPRELSAKISHPPEGDYTVEVPKVSTDGIEMSMKTLSFKCLHSPDDWQYNGIVCVN